MNFTPEQRSAMGARMWAARDAHGWTRDQFCEHLKAADPRGQPWSPQRISNYEKGERVPSELDDLWLIERVLRLDPGRLSQHLGFLPPSGDAPMPDVEDAVSADSTLTDEDRVALLRTYRSLRREADA